MEHAQVDELGCLIVEYPSPHRSDGEVLWVSADADFDEVVIGFGFAHSHGGRWANEGDPDYRLLATERFVDDILSERVVSCQLAAGARIGYLAEFRSASWWSDVRAIRSWRGTYDRDAG